MDSRPPPPKRGITDNRIDEPVNRGRGEKLLIFLSYVLLILLFPVSVFFCIQVIPEFKRAVVFRLGRLRGNGLSGPGLIFVLVCTDDMIRVDLRVHSFDIPPQEVLTKDSVSVAVDAVVYYKVNDPLKAILKVANYSESTRLLSATTLRTIMGTYDLSQLLTFRESISKTLKVTLDEATVHWGINVERVEIKDVRLPMQLQKAMAAEAEAGREARAKIIAAEGEIKASQALKEASEIMTENPTALQLRYLQSLNSIASNKSSAIIFPFPMELLRSLLPDTKSTRSVPERRVEHTSPAVPHKIAPSEEESSLD